MKQFFCIKQRVKHQQVTIEMLYDIVPMPDIKKLYDIDGTITRYQEVPMRANHNYKEMILTLKNFCTRWESLYHIPRQDLYSSFHIPKKKLKITKTSRGYEAWYEEKHIASNVSEHGLKAHILNILPKAYRQIDAPNKELKFALNELKTILQSFMYADYHTSAFAYIKKRSILHAAKKHQANKSNWFGHFDFSEFFNSINLEYSIKTLKEIYPFGGICLYGGEEILTKAIELCFLNGGLPQGTPMSPWLTNVLMIPFDSVITSKLSHIENRKTQKKDKFIYTRYADDIHISSYVEFDIKQIEKVIQETLVEFHAPFGLNESKTRYGNRKGSNYMLGIILNAENKISIGYRRKKEIKASLFNFMSDKSNGINWNIKEIQKLNGIVSYFNMIEPEMCKNIVNKINIKFNADVISELQNAFKE